MKPLWVMQEGTFVRIAADFDQKPECLCVVARPEKIYVEWRFVVADGKVITGSQYKDGNVFSVSTKYPKLAVEFVEKVVKEWQPHPIFIVDVAVTNKGSGSTFKIVEIGMINGAGFYACDLRIIVETASKIAERDFKL